MHCRFPARAPHGAGTVDQKKDRHIGDVFPLDIAVPVSFFDISEPFGGDPAAKLILFLPFADFRLQDLGKPAVIGTDIGPVPVVNIQGEYFTEMNFLHPYMKSAKIKSIAEALNNVAEANGLPVGAVGLLIESGSNVSECINKAIESANPKKEKNVLDKIGKSIDISDKLKSKGINVKKKKKGKCPKCGKLKCECGDCED